MKHRKTKPVPGKRTPAPVTRDDHTAEPSLFPDLPPRGYVRVRSYLRRKPTGTKRRGR